MMQNFQPTYVWRHFRPGKYQLIQMQPDSPSLLLHGVTSFQVTFQFFYCFLAKLYTHFPTLMTSKEHNLQDSGNHKPWFSPLSTRARNRRHKVKACMVLQDCCKSTAD